MRIALLAFCTLAMLLASPIPSAQANGTLSQVTEFNFGIDDCTTDLSKEGNFVLVGRAHDGAALVDVTNPGTPVIVSTMNPDPTSVNIVDVQLVDGMAYLFNYGSQTDTVLGNWTGLYIYDLAIPSAPTLEGYILWGNGAWHHQAARNIHGTIQKIGNTVYAYCSTRITYAVEVFDVTTPSSIIHKAQINRPGISGSVEDVIVQGATLYTGWMSDGFTMHDVTNPAAPVLLGHQPYTGAPSINGGIHTAAPTDSGNHVVTTDYTNASHVRVWDVQSPNAITQSGSWQLSNGSLAYSVAVSGDLAYVGHLEGGLQVLDISDPFNPTVCAAFDPDAATPTGMFADMRDVVVEGSRVYATHLSRGLFIVDFVATPADTVTITKADYKQRKGKLVVWATSSAQPTPTLTLVGYGTMRWKANKNRYQLTKTTSNPGNVTVASSEGGSATSTVRLRN